MSTQTEAPLLVTATEAARLLGCSVQTVKRLAEKGEIPVIRFGEPGHVRFRIADIEFRVDERVQLARRFGGTTPATWRWVPGLTAGKSWASRSVRWRPVDRLDTRVGYGASRDGRSEETRIDRGRRRARADAALWSTLPPKL